MSDSTCELCVTTDTPECCFPGDHTPSAVRLARALAASLDGPGLPERPQPVWYIDDAAAICCMVEEGDGWVVEKGCDHALADNDGFFKINGVELWFDWNGEGMTTPVLGADRRAELEAEADDGPDQHE